MTEQKWDKFSLETLECTEEWMGRKDVATLQQ